MKIESRRYIGVLVKLDEKNKREIEIVAEADMEIAVDAATYSKAIEYQRKGIPCIPVVYAREN